MKDDRRHRRKPRAVLLPDTNPRRFVVTRRPRLSKLTDYPELDFADYERRLASLQGVLQLIQQAYLGSSERALIVLEGWDTAGKGGVVRRLGWALDPRSFKVHPISAPDQHERAEHYLQRFWRHLPQNGQIVVFDRSWYGRVLVERVEGLATEAEWRRAYREINEFERVLTDSGVRLVKLFLHITSKEQARRFRDRLINSLKRWKLSYEDFRNRTPPGGLCCGDRGHVGGDIHKICTVVPDPSQRQAVRPNRGVSHPCGTARKRRVSEAAPNEPPTV